MQQVLSSNSEFTHDDIDADALMEMVGQRFRVLGSFYARSPKALQLQWVKTAVDQCGIALMRQGWKLIQLNSESNVIQLFDQSCNSLVIWTGASQFEAKVFLFAHIARD